MRLRSGLIALFGAATLVVPLAVSSAPAGAVFPPPTTPTISNIPTDVTFGDAGFTASVDTDGGGPSVTSSTPFVCTVGADNLTVTYTGAGTCALTAHEGAFLLYDPADGTEQDLTVAQAQPNPPTISNLPPSGTFGGGFVASVTRDGDGTPSVTSDNSAVCSVAGDGLTVSYVGVGDVHAHRSRHCGHRLRRRRRRGPAL